jgi:uncharacterized protein YhaN
MDGKVCTKEEKFIHIEESLKKIEQFIERLDTRQRQFEMKTELQENKVNRIDTLEARQREVELKTELQESKINTLIKNIEDLTGKMNKFNFLLISNLVAAIFMILTGLGALTFFIVSGGIGNG